MPSRALAMGIIFVSQSGAGILGNTFLFCYCVFIYCSGQRLRKTDWILMNLIFANWMKLKVKAPKYIGFPIVLCWILHILVNISVPMYITGKAWNQESKNLTEKKDLGYCSGINIDSNITLLYLVIFSSIDVLYLGFTVWVSGSMVLTLYRHKQNSQQKSLLQMLHGDRSHPQHPHPCEHIFLLLLTVFILYFLFVSL
ncbi:vomeronasal type-1 receptor 4-like [Trichechus inunguis]